MGRKLWIRSATAGAWRDAIERPPAAIIGAENHEIPNRTASLYVAAVCFNVIADKLHAAIGHRHVDAARVLASHGRLIEVAATVRPHVFTCSRAVAGTLAYAAAARTTARSVDIITRLVAII